MRRTDLDDESCYRAVKSKDRRFDGVFYTCVATTGIYCRPSCPARTPGFANVAFRPTAAACQAAGFRACKRCLPDATPGSPDWDVAADLAGRTMRLIADGLVDREGVDGLAARVGYTSRHLGRLLTQELGAGPLALARARRAQTARILIETTDMGFADVAFAAGFSSVRQFNETVREVYAVSPTQLRGRRSRPRGPDGTVVMRLPVRTPYAGTALLDFLRLRAIPGVEVVDDETYARTLALPHGPGTVTLTLPDVADEGSTAFVRAELALTDLRDTAAAVERARRLLDADCDPVAVADAFAGDRLLGPLVRRTPGLRVPGHVDGNEVAVRAVLGQQVSVAGARTIAARLTREHGAQIETTVPGLTRLFPSMDALAAVDPEDLPMPRVRGRALTSLCAALADGTVVLDRGDDRGAVRQALLDLPGIGPWTADYIAIRALGHPDVLLATDVGTRDALRALGAPGAVDTEAWRPWRSYAQTYLWQSLVQPRGDN
ncbi:MAG: DNA-O6-methylguanine--protein-cysteine S-methyltransferase / DNA-3-methyladenine glycosylase [Nocardioides sp.]|jgi:AraC family transcriptional regulator of adaptative response / DNA-3-methyladenine glycosylase II|uniref:DNA-3-methyladenine glycosylase 2 n=1 Tax=Nocardioides sp. TaxID=35761 RepID=UPI00262CABBC|nr:DNA-3-methyladenine glycosylase 2 [Nocardioides sp.]MCW2834085.1 DNA-O6-methylguanine--protein-cysteine S-methyltransferase / DNA-3-methyladenine glycosylase [Nocardioides sp.]